MNAGNKVEDALEMFGLFSLYVLDGLGSSVLLDVTLAASFAHIVIVAGVTRIIQLSKELRVEHVAITFKNR